MKVFGWAADRYGCGYYRIGLPMWGLRQFYGVDALASTVLPNEAKTDPETIIVGQRVCLQGPSRTWQELRQAGRKLVFEVDDDLWHVHPSNELAYDFFREPDTRARLTENVRVADLVTVTTEGLAEVLREYNDNVHVLPNYIDAELLTHQRPQREQLTIGWAGSTTHLPDFKSIAPRLIRFFNRNSSIDMHFIGTNYSHIIKKESRFTPWREEVADFQRSLDFDIGIAPLVPDFFNRSKSYIKALEYGALGIPIVASCYGPYVDYVQHGVTGFLVKHDHEWEKYLALLASDAGLREQMGEAAKRQAAEYTIQGNAHRWLAAYSKLAPEMIGATT